MIIQSMNRSGMVNYLIPILLIANFHQIEMNYYLTIIVNKYYKNKNSEW